MLKNLTLRDIACKKYSDKDWTRAWMKDFKPIKFGNNLWICPSWHRPPDPNAVNINLDPGLAFGTGTHPTTSLCLQWLEKNIHSKIDSLIDFGCGSGILAIAAYKLGAKQVIGIDNDPQAIESANNNAQKNNIIDNFSIYLSDLTPDNTKSNIIVANILAGTIIELKDSLMNYLSNNGHLVLSGILDSQINDVIEAYQQDFTVISIEHQEDWILIHLKRKC